ncbi:UNVERIFIED_CONTAM: Photosystem I chlorophyll a apoprotein A1 [Sesamum angustifolium]|uniref:Photosystem I chlorophyll a apoprotein A1 n=1 Tax=Sesamum angustifolium TaxID=2727405 RepID=A0AAW2IYX5_9LAMI
MIIRSPEPEVKIFVDKAVKTSFEQWAKPGHFSRTIAKGPDTTTWIWNLHADAHDFDGHTSDLEEISRKVFSAHFGQLSIIFLWLSGMYFHGARFSNYEAWLSDPTHIGPSAQIWRASGITSELQLYCTAIGALVFAALMLFAGWFHYHKAAPKLAWFQDVESMLNHHLAGLLGLGSLSWAGHQREQPHFHLELVKICGLSYFSWRIRSSNWGSMVDRHCTHHLAIAILFLIAGHMYRTNWGIGHGLKDILEAHKGPFTGQGHKGLYEILTTSWHAQLSLNLAMLGSLTIVVAHHMYSMPPYPYLATDYGTQLSLFTHHMWIGGFLIVGAAAHAAIFMVRDYDPTTRYNDLLDRVLRHRDAIISHLNWACIFLGFHSFGLYIHNDTMSALGRPQDMFSDTAIQLQPVFAQWIQNTHALAPGATASTSLTWGGGDLVAVGGKVALLPIPLGTADFLVFYLLVAPQILVFVFLVMDLEEGYMSSIGLGSCLLRTILDGMGSNIPENAVRCLGSISDQGVVTHITGGNFAQSSITINGWLRDFLWAQASQDPLHVRPIAHAIWDPHFGKGRGSFYSRGCSWPSEYRLFWLATLTTEMETERFVVQKCRISSESSFVRTLRRQWNLYAQNPDSSSHLFGTSQGAGTAILTLLGDSIHKHKVYG